MATMCTACDNQATIFTFISKLYLSYLDSLAPREESSFFRELLEQKPNALCESCFNEWHPTKAEARFRVISKAQYLEERSK